MNPPGLFRVDCASPGCGAQICGVGVEQKAIVALGWLWFYGRPLCPMHRPDGLVAGATQAARLQAAVGMARVAERLADVFAHDRAPDLRGGGGNDAPWSMGGPASSGPILLIEARPTQAPPARPPAAVQGPAPPSPWTRER